MEPYKTVSHLWGHNNTWGSTTKRRRRRRNQLRFRIGVCCTVPAQLLCRSWTSSARHSGGWCTCCWGSWCTGPRTAPGSSWRCRTPPGYTWTRMYNTMNNPNPWLILWFFGNAKALVLQRRLIKKHFYVFNRFGAKDSTATPCVPTVQVKFWKLNMFFYWLISTCTGTYLPVFIRYRNLCKVSVPSVKQ